MASITQRFLVPVSTVSARNAWHNDPPFLTQKRQKCSGEYFQKNWVGMCGTLPEPLTLFQTKICDFPYPISDLIKNLIPYFRPEALEPGAWPERVTSCYGTYTVVGVNIKREMVLLPNDEEVANSSKKHYPIQDSSAQTIPYFRPKWSKLIPYFRPKRLKKHALWHPTYPYSLYKGLPLGRKTRCRLLVSLLTQARLIST